MLFLSVWNNLWSVSINAFYIYLQVGKLYIICLIMIKILHWIAFYFIALKYIYFHFIPKFSSTIMRKKSRIYIIMTSLYISFPLVLWLCVRGKSSPWFKKEWHFEVLQIVENVSLWYVRTQKVMATWSIMEEVLMLVLHTDIPRPKCRMDEHDMKEVTCPCPRLITSTGQNDLKIKMSWTSLNLNYSFAL